jgi:hypothetical protein
MLFRFVNNIINTRGTPIPIVMIRPNSVIYNPSDKLYDSVLRSYLNSLNPPPKYEYHPNSKKVAVMIEPRYDDLTIAVLYNFMHFMAPKDVPKPKDDPESDVSRGWNFMFISHASHESAVKERFPHMNFVAIDDKYIEMRNGAPNISIESYNNIMMSTEFWENTIPDKYDIVCIFQRDCIMYRPFPRVFETYSYAGASFGDLLTDDVFMKCTPFYSVGINGGFSLRNRKHMSFCISTVSMENIRRFREAQFSILRDIYEAKYKISTKKVIEIHWGSTSEDVYFSSACEIIGLLVPDHYHCAQFAVEMKNPSILSDKPAVYHGWNKSYQSFNEAVNYLSQTELFAKFVATEKASIPKVVQESSKLTPVYVLPTNLSD